MDFGNASIINYLSDVQLLEIGPNAFSYGPLALISGFLSGQPAPGTTIDYSFLPARPTGSDISVTKVPQKTNWSAPTIGVRGRASCRSLDTPKALFAECVGSGIFAAVFGSGIFGVWGTFYE